MRVGVTIVRRALIAFALLAVSFAYYLPIHGLLLAPHDAARWAPGVVKRATHTGHVQEIHSDMQGPARTSGRTPYRRRIVAVGDLHGDLRNALRALRMSGVIDDNSNWSRHVDFFVQTGDVIDRGDDTKALFTLMDKLRGQAKRAGATVLLLLGNHEWMNMLGDWSYVTQSEIQTFGGIDARQEMIFSGTIGKSWAANYTSASRLPLHPSQGPPDTPYPPTQGFMSTDGPLSHAAIAFVHGGLSPTYDGLSPFPTRINDLSASLMKKLQDPKRQLRQPYPKNQSRPTLPNTVSKSELEFIRYNGPLWYRGWAQSPEPVICPHVDAVLAATGTRRMVMGHTPSIGILKRCNGKIIIIDTGISRGVHGIASALYIQYTVTPVGEDAEQRWVERETISALYATPQDRVISRVIVDEERQIIGDFQVAD